MQEDFIIVGSGFFGCVLAERIANDLNKNVTIFEKRNHLGGNCYSEIDKKTGIEFHKYGSHIFHTSNKDVWDYINNFTKFNSYHHQVLSSYKNRIYQLPFNLETINSAYNKNLNPEQAKIFISNEIKKLEILKPENFEEKALSMVGEKLYKMFIKGYTLKQWGTHPKNLPSSIINRIPVRYNYNENYFLNSKWQGIPLEGYTSIFNNLLDNKRIKIKYNYEFDLSKINTKKTIIYTGPLDRLFNYEFGRLEWRSLRFEKKYFKLNDFQGTSVVNYPELKNSFTRIHEPKHLHPERNYAKDKTMVIYEYPVQNLEEPYYPINNSKNRITHRKYKTLANRLNNFFIGGRLADYAYYDMDMTISAALKLYYRSIKKSVND
jgi:UDP-galactopyranose mutase